MTEAEAINDLTAALKQLTDANLATASDLVPLSALQEELAALDSRHAALVVRRASSFQYGSRRFGGLNDQTMRHRLARIQERQIELREQIKNRNAA